jgi:hypothetical protein
MRTQMCDVRNLDALELRWKSERLGFGYKIVEETPSSTSRLLCTHPVPPPTPPSSSTIPPKAPSNALSPLPPPCRLRKYATAMVTAAPYCALASPQTLRALRTFVMICRVCIDYEMLPTAHLPPPPITPPSPQAPSPPTPPPTRSPHSSPHAGSENTQPQWSPRRRTARLPHPRRCARCGRSS